MLSQPLLSRNPVNNSQKIIGARRATSPLFERNSSSASISISENSRKVSYDFPLPRITYTNIYTFKRSAKIIPSRVLDFNSNSADDDDDDTMSSLFSRQNATPAALNHMKNIEDIIQGDETPRTRTIIQIVSNNGNKDISVEYDDESASQSHISSIDGVTVDKASPPPSTSIDFLEDI